MTPSDCVTWLRERTELNSLSVEILTAIAPLLQTRIIPAHQRPILAGKAPDGLWILRRGKVESDREQLRPISYLPGAVVNLQALLLNQPLNNPWRQRDCGAGAAICDRTASGSRHEYL